MPNYKEQTQTKTSRKAGRYIKYAEDFLGKDAQLKKAFEGFQASMKELQTETTKFYAADSNGNLPEFKQEDLGHMTLLYEKALKMAVGIKELAVKKGLGSKKTFYQSMDTISGFLSKDLENFRQHLPAPGTTLPDYITGLNTKYVDFRGKDQAAQSGFLSSRVPMVIEDNGQIIPGLFTEESKVGTAFEKGLKEALNTVNTAQGLDELKQFLSDLKDQLEPDMSETQFFYSLRLKDMKDGSTVPVFNPPAKDTRAAKFFNNFWETYEKVPRNDPRCNIFNSLKSLIRIAAEAKEPVRNYTAAGVPWGSNIDNRNCAMSAVAELIGLPDIIAKAVPMTVETDDGMKTGTFMKFAKGSLPDTKIKNDPLLDITPEAADQSSGIIKAAANLQVLDFICGNIDRHSNNFAYQTRAGKLTGLQGYDNDYSFLPIEDEYLSGEGTISHFSGIRQMRFIPMDTAEKIRDLSPEVLHSVLSHYKLTSKEINDACHRLEYLKKSLDFRYVDPEHGEPFNINEKSGPALLDGKKLYVLNQDQINELNISRDLFERGTDPKGRELSRNIFTRIHQKTVDIQAQKSTWRLKEGKPADDFETAKVQYKAKEISFKKWAEQLGRHIRDLDSANKGLFVSSPEYKNLLRYANYMQKTIAGLAGHENDPATMTKIYNMYENLNILSAIYLDHKETDGTSKTNETAGKRKLAVSGLMDNAINRLKKFNLSDRDYFRFLSALQRRGVYNRKIDNKKISATISKMEKGEDVNLGLANILDGISERSWGKTFDQYADEAERLNRIIQSSGAGLNLPDDLSASISEIASAIKNAPRKVRGLQDVEEKLASISRQASEYLGELDPTSITQEQIPAVMALHGLINLKANAAKGELAPAADGKVLLAERLFSMTAPQEKPEVLTDHQAFNRKIASIRNRNGFDLMTAGKSDKKIRELAQKPAKDLLSKYQAAKESKPNLVAEKSNMITA